MQVSALRRALGSEAIRTVPGVGYLLAPGPAPEAPEGPALPDTPSLVVLPFANLTGDASRDYLVDGIVTDLIAALSRISGLFVIAASSSFRYKGVPVDLKAVGQELGVRYVLEGAIQQAGDALRVTVQLAEADSGHTIWSERIAGAASDLFDLQDRLTEQVAGAIEPTLLIAEAGRAAQKPTSNLAAYDLCLQAIPDALRPRSPDAFRQAVACLDRAIALDPAFARARAWRCYAFLTARASKWITKEECRDTVGEAARWLLLEGHRDPLVLAFSGFTDAYLDKNRDASVRAVRQAVALNPNSVLVLNAAAWVESYVGEVETAIAHVKRALRLDPVGHVGAYLRQCWGIAEFMAGRPEASVEVLETALSLDRANWGTMLALIGSYWFAGREDDARRMAAEVTAVLPDLSVAQIVAEIAYTDRAHLDNVRMALLGAGMPP